jgi:uncharacterized protein Veg
MKYKNAQFTVNLKESIAELERELQNTCTSLLKKYQPLFAERNLLFEIELTRGRVSYSVSDILHSQIQLKDSKN